MTRLAKSLLMAVPAASCLAAPAATQTVCGTRAAIVAELESKYGETRRSIGLAEGRGVVEVYASDETGSWTIVVTNTAGRTCLLAAGEAFEAETLATVDTPA